MFKFLKEKLKKAISKFSKKVEKEAEIKEEEKIVEVKEEVKEVLKKEVKEKKAEKEVPKELVKEVKEVEEEKEEEKETKEKEVKEIIKEEPEEVPVPEPEEMPVPEPEVPVAKAEEEVKKEEPERKKEEKKKQKPTKREFEKAEEEVEEIETELESDLRVKKESELTPEEKPKQSFFQKLFGRKEKPEEKKEEEEKEEKKPKVEKKEEEKEEEKETKEKEEIAGAEVPKEKKGLFKKIKERFTTIKLSEEKFEKLFWELEMALLENNVAVEVIDKIKADLKADLTTGKVSRKGVYDLIEDSLRESVESLFIDQHFNLVKEIKNKKEKPYIIAFIGVNGSGKTTTMAKVAHLLLENKLSVVFAASDTFRAAAIQQLQEHADKLGVKMIKHDYESDPAAVAFDALKHAKAKGIDVVMIDTAGRLHSNENLMNELKKLVRVNKPDLKIFVGESITGNDCIEQAKIFNEAVGIDVVILAKADVDEKGGAAVSVSYVTKKPIIYLGSGQGYNDLVEFKPEIIIKNIGL